ncbi:MAG: tryptophan--tRNA ligase [Candidatus Parvarchaeota archaeon]|nr:tryptophan--tRNA ligase [Candidatus Parvarchaeota archaeon]MCW1301527.1 tryptophan--tRNA ligase [Candidatus Parvarchaeota archaeon]
MEELNVTPWEVSGRLDEAAYSKLVQRFGASLIDDKILEKIKSYTKDLHPYLKNRLFYAHRNLDSLLDGYKKNEKFYLYTGRGPSGKMHIGHLIPFRFTKWLQDKFDVHLLIQITDDEKFMVKEKLTKEEVERIKEDNIISILSLGFKPEKTHVIADYQSAKTLYYYATDVAKKVTVSTIKAVFGVNDSDNIGKLFFPSIQIVPAFLLSALSGERYNCLIPYAIDQDPYFRVARDVLPKLGFEKPASIMSKFIPALRGQTTKMSSSDEMTGIFLDDDEKTVKRKLMKYAFSGGRDTLEEQKKYGANIEVDFAFNSFMTLEDDADKIDKIREEYSRGEITSGEMKEIAADTINRVLEQIRKNREKVKDDLDKFMFDEEKLRDQLKRENKG